jgi:MFS family permease
VNGYDSSTFNSVQGYSSFVNKFREAGHKKIDPNIIGAVNTGESKSRGIFLELISPLAYNCGGIVTGFLITPSVSKRFGRRCCIVTGLTLVIVSSFIQAFAPNMSAFIAGRLVMGLGQGFAIPTGPTYIAEIAPAKVRGRMMSFYQREFVPYCSYMLSFC